MVVEGVGVVVAVDVAVVVVAAAAVIVAAVVVDTGIAGIVDIVDSGTGEGVVVWQCGDHCYLG